jgi:hypothetical protein
MKRETVTAVDLERLEKRMWLNTNGLVTRLANRLVGDIDHNDEVNYRKFLLTWAMGILALIGMYLLLNGRPVTEVRYANYPQCHELDVTKALESGGLIVEPTVDP